jgi:hypothetical protein
MPIHDWTRVSAGTWHAFHLSWTSEIQLALNNGLMPAGYYAQAEQIIGPLGPDVLALQIEEVDLETDRESTVGGVAVALAPPLPKLIAVAEMDSYALKRRQIVVRHSSGDRAVALLELVSPGNKGSKKGLATFVEKAVEAIYRGFHMLIVDLFPPTPRDPNGIHAAIWEEFTDQTFTLPKETPLTLVSYSCGESKRAYLEATAVGRVLIPMPLFLEPEIYINVPLEETYQTAFRGVPKKWKQVLEAA